MSNWTLGQCHKRMGLGSVLMRCFILVKAAALDVWRYPRCRRTRLCDWVRVSPWKSELVVADYGGGVLLTDSADLSFRRIPEGLK